MTRRRTGCTSRTCSIGPRRLHYGKRKPRQGARERPGQRRRPSLQIRSDARMKAWVRELSPFDSSRRRILKGEGGSSGTFTAPVRLSHLNALCELDRHCARSRTRNRCVVRAVVCLAESADIVVKLRKEGQQTYQDLAHCAKIVSLI